MDLDTAPDGQIMFPQSVDLVGTWRRFGPLGPVYEIVGVGPQRHDEQFMRIRVVESGEEVEYRLLDILDDPRDR